MVVEREQSPEEPHLCMASTDSISPVSWSYNNRREFIFHRDHVALLLFILHFSFVSLYVFPSTSFPVFKVIEEIVEMMENSPDPGETEEEDEEEISRCSSRTNPSLLEEIRQLSQASNNNVSHEGQSKASSHERRSVKSNPVDPKVAD